MSTVAKLFMKFTGPNGLIEGDSVTEYFEKQIEIDDWKWSVQTKDDIDTAKGSPGPSSSRQGHKTEASEFSFSKLMDRASPTMLLAMNSKLPSSAELTLQEMSRGAFELKITLTGVRITSYSVDGKNEKAGGSIDESWTFNYRTIKFDFKPTKTAASGSTGGAMTSVVTRPADATTGAPSSEFEKARSLVQKTAMSKPQRSTLIDDINNKK